MPVDIRFISWPVAVQLGALVCTLLFLSIVGAVSFRLLRRTRGIAPSSETVTLILGIYGAIYGALLAFVIVIAWDDLNAAKARVDSEAASLTAVARDADFLPSDVRNRISNDIKEYLNYTVTTEWREMKLGKVPNTSNPHLEHILLTLKKYNPANEREVADYRRIRSDLTTTVSDRRARIGDSGEQLPPLLRYFIFGGAICVVLLACWYSVASIIEQAVLLTAVSVLLASSLLIILQLNHPFVGEISVSPDAFYRGTLSRYMGHE
ncbi:bestrophin-like domain [Streptomyces sp. 900105245]